MYDGMMMDACGGALGEEVHGRVVGGEGRGGEGGALWVAEERRVFLAR